MQSAFIVLYCYLCSVWLYHSFSTLSRKRLDLGGGDIERKMRNVCLTSSIDFIRNTPNSNMHSTRCHKRTQVFMSSAHYSSQIFIEVEFSCRSQWPRGLRRRSAAAHLLRLWVRIQPGAWMCLLLVLCVVR